MKRKQGFIATTTVIIISAILLSVVASSISRSISYNNSSFDTVLLHRAQELANACAEYALLELQRTLNYSGSEVIDVGSDTCEIDSITGSGIYDRTIFTEGAALAYEYRLQVVVEEVSPAIIISSWERVAQ